jgi:hypothetical protein
MGRAFFAGRAEFFKIKLPFNGLLVFAGVIIYPSAFGALEPYEVFGISGLCHVKYNLAINSQFCKFGLDLELKVGIPSVSLFAVAPKLPPAAPPSTCLLAGHQSGVRFP